ncbi:hypothetical protein [Promicromonospora sp. NPDC023987]|uniref:YobI family P-loop NTPase n=1 Tax=Promicromonospora sp. NPDC023987 TaxID=3155360 RepID=UPI00340145B9
MAENDPEQQGKAERHVKLRTLAPEYVGNQHDIYVRHLEEAIRETKNRNIALTGRYGSGKSSVLDAFEKKHQGSTVRISINTLGPDEDDEDLTNRIQKELVKQLVYRLKPGQIRRSRFARPKPLTWWRAFFQAFGVSVIGVGLMWLFGVRPASNWPGAAASTTYQAWLGLLFFVLVLLAVWGIRWLVGDRIVSEVTTAGTKIALGEGPTTYFDSFLDEIVAFFDAVEPKYVIFEDLDRFDDPQIFDSLRELNTLINASARWRRKKQPVRFIYAIKDSLFEQLGAEPDREYEGADDEEAAAGAVAATKPRLDVAAAAVRRANRTKFFEQVIPIVPFISHRNARDHLVNVLKSLNLREDVVSRPLVDLVARHTTDMRLMINICNEFAVFAEHLFWTDNPAPGMTTDHLFALVAYKNFHLADFEAIPQGTSTLDELERHHRDHVRTLIEGLQKQRRDRMRTEEQRERKERIAAELATRLRDIRDLFPSRTGRTYTSVTVDNQNYMFDYVNTVDFWEQIAKIKSFSLNQPPNNMKVTLTAEQINRLFPEVMGSAQWLDPDAAELERLLRQYDEDIAMLRGADFATLARYERSPKEQIPFDQRIADVLGSELARDLVRRGFLTRNYAEYSAIFYGNFVGVDVAFFYNHSVQPNEMYLDYEFTSKNAISNLLEQVPSDFTSSVSALNIQVASHLLRERPADAVRLVTYIVTHDNQDVRAFLDAFLNEPEAPRDLLVQQLTEHPWPDVLEYLASHPGLPDEETRLELLTTALLNVGQVDSFEIGESTRALLKASCPDLTAVREQQPPPQTERVFAVLEAVDLHVTDLGELSEPLRDRIVAAHRYEITMSNLQLALGIDNVPTLDEVRKDPAVWELCKARVSDYLTAMQADAPTEPIVSAATVLIDVLNEQRQSWTEDQLRDVIKASAPSIAIKSIRDVPQPLWSAIVEAGFMVPTLDNVHAYVNAHGFDSYLAAELAPDGVEPVELLEIEEVTADAREYVAVCVLNAADLLPAQARVRLVSQMDIDSGITLSEVTPRPEQLLARALEAKVLPDDVETFAHFAQGGWQAVSEAFTISENVPEFMEPALVEGFVAEFLESQETPFALRRAVVESIGNYLPDDDASALRAAGRFASSNRIWLSLEDVRRIARVTKTADAVLPQLVHARHTSPIDLADVLASLGEPYDNLGGGAGTEFDLPAGSSNETLFGRLEAAGRVKIVPKRSGRGRKVQNLA